MAAQNSDKGISGDGVFTSFLSGSSLNPTSGTSPKYDSIKMSFGSNLYHNNIAPAIASYIWKRTAQSVGELPNHSHTVYTDDNFCAVNTGNNNAWKQALANVNTPESGVSYSVHIGAVGYNVYHNNIAPCRAVYIWKRTVQSVGEMPSHCHEQYVTANPGTGLYNTRKDYESDEINLDIFPQVNTGNTGGDLYHNKLPTVIATYCWKRFS